MIIVFCYNMFFNSAFLLDGICKLLGCFLVSSSFVFRRDLLMQIKEMEPCK